MAKQTFFTGKNIAILGGVGLLSYFLFSSTERVDGSGGGGQSIFQSLKEMGGGFKDVFQSTKEFISETGGLIGAGAGAVGTGVGTGTDIVRVIKKDVERISGVGEALRPAIPMFTGVSPLTQMRAEKIGGGFISLGGGVSGIIDIPSGIATQIVKRKGALAPAPPTKKETKRDIPRGIFEVVKASVKGGGVPYVPFI